MKTKKQQLADCHAVYEAAKTGTKPKAIKNEGIQTHPIVPVPPLPEAEVLKGCMKWLTTHRVFHNRHDCGSGHGNAVYGIKYSGDIHGILPSGVHFEIECKAGRGGRLSAGQRQRMADVQANNGLYFVVHGVPELEYYMKGLI